MKFLLIIFASLSLLSCVHVDLEHQKQLREQLLHKEFKAPLYNNIKNVLIRTNAFDLKECNCMAAFTRNLFEEPDQSSRYIFDEKVGDYAKKLTTKDVSVLVIGAGLLLNELTAIANILAQGKNAKIYLNDWAYVFYEDKDFPQKALDLGNHPDKLPEGYKGFYFWSWAKNKEWPYLPFFEKHHRAIDQFKLAIRELDTIYGTSSTIEIIKPPAQEAITLPPIDLIISIDSFTDIPNLTKILFYQLKLTKNPVRFMALNKTKNLGGFWEGEEGKTIVDTEKKPVLISSFEVTSFKEQGSYKRLLQLEMGPSAKQIQRLQKAKNVSPKDSTQSPFDL